MAARQELPTCISIVLCESIYRDEASGNLIVVGTFNNIFAQGFPLLVHKMSVLFTLTGGPGQYEVSLSVEHERSGQTLMEMKGPMTLSNPLSINDFMIDLRGLEFTEAGKYWLVLKANEVIINQRPFAVLRRDKAETGQKP